MRRTGRPISGVKATALGSVLDERGIKRRWLADRLGISPTFLSNVVAGQRRMAMPTAQRAAELLGLPFSLLFDPSSEAMNPSHDVVDGEAA